MLHLNKINALETTLTEQKEELDMTDLAERSGYGFGSILLQVDPGLRKKKLFFPGNGADQQPTAGVQKLANI